MWWAGQRTGSEEESPVAVHPGRAGTEMNAWATVERQMEDGATVHEVNRVTSCVSFAIGSV